MVGSHSAPCLSTAWCLLITVNPSHWFISLWLDTGSQIILGMGSASERRHYNVTSSLIGRVHAHNNPWGYLYLQWHYFSFGFCTNLDWSMLWGAPAEGSKLFTLHWRHNECEDVSNHQCLDCLLSRLIRRRSKKTSKLRVTCLCEGISPVTGEFPAKKASKAENVSIWLRHHVMAPYWWTEQQDTETVTSPLYWLIATKLVPNS